MIFSHQYLPFYSLYGPLLLYDNHPRACINQFLIFIIDHYLVFNNKSVKSILWTVGKTCRSVSSLSYHSYCGLYQPLSKLCFTIVWSFSILFSGLFYEPFFGPWLRNTHSLPFWPSSGQNQLTWSKKHIFALVCQFSCKRFYIFTHSPSNG